MELDKLNKLLEVRTPGLMDATGRYAVLVPLVESEQGWQVLYEVRAAKLHRQPGEVCFPGGKMEGTESPESCALRETWEELSIPQDHIHLLGRLAEYKYYNMDAIVVRALELADRLLG